MSENLKSLPLIQYIPPKLTPGKEWYISFYAVYPETGKLRRVKIKLNRIKGIKQRKQFAADLISEITVKLRSGWNPFISAETPKSYQLFFRVCDRFIEIHKKESEHDTVRTYKSYIKHLKEFLLRNGYNDKMYVSQFNKNIATDIMLEMKENEKYAAITYNNYLRGFNTFFNWMLQFNYITENPFSHIRRIPQKKIDKKRKEVGAADRSKLLKFLEVENPNYLAICMLCYYCFIRPKEIALLKIRDIDIVKQVIYVGEDIAKNDNDTVRTIPDSMMPFLMNLNLNYPPDYYLFSADKRFKFDPGKKPLGSRGISRYWTDVIRPIMKFPMTHQFYSLKDTGITNMLENGVSVNVVQGQADHSDLSMTSKYISKRNKKAQEEIKIKVSGF